MKRQLLTICFLLLSFNVFASVIDSKYLFQNPDVSAVKLSPLGTYVSSYVYNDRTGWALSFYDVKSDKNFTRLNLDFGTRLREYVWINDSQLIIRISSENKGKLNFLGTLKGSKLNLKHIKVPGFILDPLLDEPDFLLLDYEKRTKRGLRKKIYKISTQDYFNSDISNATEINTKVEGELLSINYNSKNDAFYGVSQKDDKRTLLFKEGNKKWKVVYTFDKTEEYDVTPLTTVGNGKIAVLTNKDSDKMVLRLYNYVQGVFEDDIVYQHPDYDLESATFDNDNNLAAVSYFEKGLLRKKYFSSENEKINKSLSKTFKNSEISIIDSTLDRTQHIIFISGSSNSGQYYLYNSKKNRAHTLYSRYFDIDDKQLTQSKHIRITSQDGLVIEGYYSKAQGKNFNSLLVMPHGGPIGVRDYDDYNQAVQFYTSRGFSVLRVNFRGSSGFGKAFQEGGVGNLGKLIESDISAVVNEVLGENSYRNVCSIGASYGGYSAVMLAIKKPELYKCAVAAFGVYDLPLLYNQNNQSLLKDERKKVKNVLGDHSMEKLDEVSPVHLVDKIQAPVLLIAGKEDSIVSFEHTNRLKYLLKKEGKAFETAFYKDTGHGHGTWTGDRHEAAITFDFLVRTLKLDLNKLKLSKKDKESISNDYAIIADKFTFDDEIENDEVLADEYYQKAAKFGNGRAIFNLAAESYSAYDKDLDLNKVMAAYKQSSEAGYHGAQDRLAWFSMLGKHVSQDYALANELLTESEKQEWSVKNHVYQSMLQCSKGFKQYSIDTCLKELEPRKYKAKGKSTFNSAKSNYRPAFAYIFNQKDLSKEEREKIFEAMNPYFETNKYIFKIENLEIGKFKKIKRQSYKEEDRIELEQTGQTLTLDDDHRFGIQFTVNSKGIDLRSDRIAVFYKVYALGKNGKPDYLLEHSTLYSKGNNDWSVRFKPETVRWEDKVRIELYDIYGETKLKKDFALQYTRKQKQAISLAK